MEYVIVNLEQLHDTDCIIYGCYYYVNMRILRFPLIQLNKCFVIHMIHNNTNGMIAGNHIGVICYLNCARWYHDLVDYWHYRTKNKAKVWFSYKDDVLPSEIFWPVGEVKGGAFFVCLNQYYLNCDLLPVSEGVIALQEMGQNYSKQNKEWHYTLSPAFKYTNKTGGE